MTTHVMEGEKTRLRPMTLEEADLVFAWLGDPEVNEFWGGRDRTRSKEEFLTDWKPYYFDGSEPERGRCFAIEAEGRPIGMIAYNAIIRRDRSVDIDVIIGEKAYWSRGYGTDAIRAFLRYLFEVVGMHRVALGTYATNARAIRCYEKCGFVREGVQRESEWVDGRWVDAVLMSVLEQEFGRE
jgi:ribosomal-protein-alanine N-acetyltransferase